MIGQHSRRHGRGFRILEWVALLSLLGLQAARAQDELAPTTTLSAPDDPSATPNVPTCTHNDGLTGPFGGTACEIINTVMNNCADTLTPPTEFSLSGVLNQTPQRYPPPGRDSPFSPCECTEAAYNLFSACAACQAGDNPLHWTDRSTWFANCKNSSQPLKVPPGNDEGNFDIWMTSVYEPTFNVTLAQTAAITNTPPPLPSPEIVDGSSASGSTTPTSSDSQDSPSSKKSNTGLIVGVVVGVVGLFALLALALFLYRRRQKKSRVPPSAEFMKYAQHDRLGSMNLPTASHPLMANMGTTEDEEAGRSRTNLRGSVIKLDGTDTSHEGGGIASTGTAIGGGVVSGSMERDGAPPAFSPGLFKDPIFEKGVALNLAGMSGGGGASSSPVTYSPATPSSVVQNNTNTEKQRLIQSRNGTA